MKVAATAKKFLHPNLLCHQKIRHEPLWSTSFLATPPETASLAGQAASLATLQPGNLTRALPREISRLGLRSPRDCNPGQLPPLCDPNTRENHDHQADKLRGRQQLAVHDEIEQDG